MGKQWANLGDTPVSAIGADLHVELSGPGLRTGLMSALREAVRTGRLAPGSRLPSSRALAMDLGVARNTVAAAYSGLIAEGWLTARQGAGTRVAKRAEPRQTEVPARRHGDGRFHPTYGLMPGSPNLAEFPRTQWLSAARRALTTAPNDAFGYGDAAGRLELRTALADYLSRSRGVHAEPQRVVICSGFHQGLTLVAEALKVRRVRTVAVESYGFATYRALLLKAGLRVEVLEVDQYGARTADLAKMSDVGAVLLTPAHQYPTGVELRSERRTEVVNWARRTGGVILEDDYDGEFRYDRQPVGALQSLDPGHVMYIGSVSKSLAPGLRLAWMVVPEDLAPEIVAAKGDVDWSSSLEQLTLAEFITSGGYDRQVRSMRIRYRRRRDQLITALAHAAPAIEVTGMDAGLQAVLQLPPGTERETVMSAAGAGLAVSGLADYRADAKLVGGTPAASDALVIGYASPSDSAWAGTLETLCRVLAATT